MNLTLFDSYVEHKYLFPWSKKKIDFIEGFENRAEGVVYNKSINVKFTNSFGLNSYVEGTYIKLLFLLLLKGTAYGYSNYPNGRRVYALGWFYNKHLHLRVPSFDASYLSIKLKYRNN